MKDQLPPLHVAIVGSLLLAWGMFAFVGMTATALAGYPSWDLGFLIVFLGWGVLNRNRSCWMMSIIIALLFLGPAVVFACLYPAGKIPWNYPDSPRDMIGNGLLAAASIYVLIVLLRPRQREWFKRAARGDDETSVDPGVATRIASAVLVVSFLLSSLYRLNEWWNNETLRATYGVNTRLIAYDEEGGDVSGVLGLSSPSDSRRRREVELPLCQVSSSHEGSSKVFTIHGLANRPFRVLVSGGDYEAKSVLLDKNSPDEIRVPMKRAKE
jgi:hypothetical protein